MMGEVKEFKALGNRVIGALGASELETFPVQRSVTEVQFSSAELTAFCPVTHQPDLYTIYITFEPNEHTVESKTLKLYLNGFRDVGIFAEDLADVICNDLFECVAPVTMEVILEQQVRGGLVLTTTARLDEQFVAGGRE